MTYSKQRLKEVTALKRQAVRLIQNDIGEIDASPSRKYIQEFNREFLDIFPACRSIDLTNVALDPPYGRPFERCNLLKSLLGISHSELDL